MKYLKKVWILILLLSLIAPAWAEDVELDADNDGKLDDGYIADTIARWAQVSAALALKQDLLAADLDYLTPATAASTYQPLLSLGLGVEAAMAYGLGVPGGLLPYDLFYAQDAFAVDPTYFTFPSSGGTSTLGLAFTPVVSVVPNGTVTLGTAEIADGACATVVSVEAAGIIGKNEDCTAAGEPSACCSGVGDGTCVPDIIDPGFQGSPVGVTGYDPTGNGLSVIAYPTHGYANFQVCNHTGAAVTPAQLTLSWGVRR